ncbi:MAG TPA: sensor domain-containing protein [Streptosporangiaceae bacterium]|nr:sensor domain-containing protein [Streptosporangiaceae bacterium]
MNSAITAKDQPPGPPVQAWHGTFTPAGPALRPAGVPRERGGLRRSVLRLLRESFSRAGRRERAYAALGLLLAIPTFALVAYGIIVGFGMSLSFAGMLVGLPLLLVTLLGARQFGALHRRLARRLLGLQVEPPPPLPRPDGVLHRVGARLTDPVAWRACAYLLLKLPVAALAAVLASYVLIYGVPYLTFPIWWEILHAAGVVIHVPQWLAWWTADPLVVAGEIHSLAVSFALVPVGASVFLWAPLATKHTNNIDRKLIASLLGPSLPHRVRELERTRASAVEDSAARLRRIERDLHDGAQAQMVAVAMKLGLAREKLGGPSGPAGPDGPDGLVAQADVERALELVDAAHRSAKEAIVELRSLARGIHPPVLDHGLGTALATLAARSGLPVELVADLPQRPSAAIETIAYFCAAELLANVAKHSGARHATLEAVHVPGLLRVRVSDDGTGGARVVGQGGLAGLAERLRTVDGRLDISSPPNGPTVVTVELPSRA